MDLLTAADAACSAEIPTAPPSAPSTLVSLSAELAAAVATKTKECLKLGTLGMVGELQEQWDGARPEVLPYEGLDDASVQRPYTTLQSFTVKEKGTKDPVSINSKAPQIGIAVFESLVRVLLSCTPTPGVSPLSGLAAQIAGGPAAHCKHGHDDGQIVQLMIVMQGHRVQTKRTANALYVGLDQTILTLLNKAPGLSPKLDGWGFHLAQLYVDFFRSLGELAAMDCWEKHQTLTEYVILSKLRTLGYMWPQFRLSEDTLTSICERGKK